MIPQSVQRPSFYLESKQHPSKHGKYHFREKAKAREKSEQKEKKVKENKRTGGER
jgi:hypothetical protein